MYARPCAAAITGLVSFVSGCGSAAPEPPGAALTQIQGQSYRLEPAYLLSVHVPSSDVDRVLAAAVSAVSLDYGSYDQVAYLDAPGLEQFRPREGSKAGAEKTAGRAPTTNVSFSVPRDTAVLQKALDAVYSAHSYEEPVIYISEVWRSRSINPDDSNPNRWWNRSR